MAIIELKKTSQSPNQITPKMALLEAGWAKLLTRKEIGFPSLPSIDADWTAIHDRVRACAGTKRLIVVGIGGSSLGTRVIYEAFADHSFCQMFFLESLDPLNWRRLKSLGPEWHESHVLLVSKSGGTLETLAWIEKLSSEKYLRLDHCTVISSPTPGALQEWAKANQVSVLSIPENVGGRFSVLTAVGMFPAGLMGLNIENFRKGAQWALEQPQLAAQLGAEALLSWERGQWITQMWTYLDSLGPFGQWWQQLWSESLAKRLDRSGSAAARVSTPMTCVGSRDQHSVLQQLMEGERDKHIFILRVESLGEDVSFHPKQFPNQPYAPNPISIGEILHREVEAFEISLAESRIEHCTMSVQDVSETSLGALFMLWQMAIGQLGEVLTINAFDQPGVESAKKHVSQLLRE